MHSHLKFYQYNEKLEVFSTFKYIGVYFFKDGNWSRTQKCIADHASKAMFRLFSILNHYEFKTLQKGKLVGSVLNYSSERNSCSFGLLNVFMVLVPYC